MLIRLRLSMVLAAEAASVSKREASAVTKMDSVTAPSSRLTSTRRRAPDGDKNAGLDECVETRRLNRDAVSARQKQTCLVVSSLVAD